MSNNIIDLPQLRADIDATDRMHAALQICVDETGERILSEEGRMQLVAALACGVLSTEGRMKLIQSIAQTVIRGCTLTLAR